MKRIALFLLILLVPAFALAEVSAKAVPGIPVEGKVLGPDGKGLAGARVEVRPVLRVYEQGVRDLEGRGEPDPVAKTATEIDGWYRIEVPREGIWRVVIAAKGFVTMDSTPMALIEETSLDELSMKPDSGLLIRVEGADGKPVAGARVAAETGSRSPWSSWRPVPRIGISGADGTLRLPRTGKETLRLTALAPGYAPGRADNVDASSLTLRLPPGRRWTLRTHADKKLVADALVRDAASLLPIGRTDAEGTLIADAPAAGPWGLRVDTRDGRLAPFKVPEHPKTVPQDRPRTLILPPLVPLSGRVVDQMDGRPVPGALVWPADDPAAFARTDAAGNYAMGWTAKTAGWLRALARGYFHGQGSFFPEPGSHTAPSLALNPSGSLTGVTIDERGHPVTGAEIRAFTLDGKDLEVSRARSSVQGRFRVANLSRGASYQLLAAAPGLSPAREGVTLGEKAKELTGLRLVLKPGRRARGRVVDPFGQPVAGAQVELVRNFAAELHLDDALLPGLTELSADGGLYRADTRKDGHFEIAGLPAGWFDLEVRLPGFVTLALSGVEVGEEPDLGVFTLQPGATLAGRVVGPEGEPIADAEVWSVLESPRERELREARGSGPTAVTGPDGRFLLTGLNPADMPDLEICRRGYLTTFLSPDEGPVEVTLRRVARLSGRVVDPDGGPVAGASVHAKKIADDAFLILHLLTASCSEAAGGGSGQGDTDVEGRFVLEPLTGGSFELWAGAERFLQTEPVAWQVEPGRDNDGPVLKLTTRAALLTGRVLASGGTPVAGARVATSVSDAWEATDGDGRFRLSGIKPGERIVLATHPEHGAAERAVEVQPGENHLELTLEPHEQQERRELRGRVVGPDGEPVAGALVEARPDRGFVYSAADGSFILGIVAEEGFELVAQKAGYSLARLDDWSVAGATEGLELRLGRLSGLSGRILGVAPEDLPEVRVWAGDRLLERAGFVDWEGTYRILGIEPGEWQVTAQLERRVGTARVVIRPEETATLDLNLPLMIEVEGRVVGEQGEPVAEAAVVLRSAAGGARSYSGEDGSFSVEVKAGTYTLLAQKHGHVARYEEPVTVADSAVEGLEIRMALGASVSGRILGLSPEALPRTKISVGGSLPEGTVEKDGTYRIDSLAPGEWQVSARSGLETVTRTVTILPGQEEAELDLLFSPGDLTLSGRVVAYRNALQICLERLGEPASAACVVPDADGSSFRFQELRPGPYLLSMTDDFARTVFQQEIDLATDLELVIPVGQQP